MFVCVRVANRVCRYSWYTVMRNDKKFLSRTKVKPTSNGGAIPSVLREATLQLCLGARSQLQAALRAAEKALKGAGVDGGLHMDWVLSEQQVPGLGACWCTA